MYRPAHYGRLRYGLYSCLSANIPVAVILHNRTGLRSLTLTPTLISLSLWYHEFYMICNKPQNLIHIMQSAIYLNCNSRIIRRGAKRREREISKLLSSSAPINSILSPPQNQLIKVSPSKKNCRTDLQISVLAYVSGSIIITNARQIDTSGGKPVQNAYASVRSWLSIRCINTTYSRSVPTVTHEVVQHKDHSESMKSPTASSS